MAAYFVDSNAAGLGDGSSWANAYTTIALALARPILAGDTLWVSDIHNESTASNVTWTFPGTTASPNFVYCADHTVAAPGTGDLKTTGKASTTGGTSLTIGGSFYCHGMQINVSSGVNAGSLSLLNTGSPLQSFNACALAILGTAAAGKILWGNQGRMLWTNVTVQFGNTGCGIAPGSGQWLWRNTPSAIQGATLPSTLFLGAAGNSEGGSPFLEGIDLNALGSGKTVVAASFAQTCAFAFFFKDCKFGTGVTVAATPTQLGQVETFVTRSDSAGTNYIEQVYKYTGTQVDETTIVRTGGASDGTTPKSRKITTTANSKWVLPFESNPMAIWSDKAGVPVTVSVYGTWNQAAVPNTDDIWIEAEYLGAASSPLGSFATSTKANNLATGIAYAADTSTWGGGGSGAGWSPFVMQVTFTPQQKGVVYITPKAAKASSTFYVDPKPVLS